MSDKDTLVIPPITKSKLWKMAQRIAYLQKKASEATNEEKKNMDWDMIEEDWFDWLTEQLTEKKE